MSTLETTMTKSQAKSILRENNKIAKAVIYLKKLDKEMIYRMGKKSDNRITRVRHHEDDRPMTQVNRRTKQIESKRNEIIIAKDIEPDAYGHFHYALQPAYNMLMSTFKEKLTEIGDQMRAI